VQCADRRQERFWACVERGRIVGPLLTKYGVMFRKHPVEKSVTAQFPDTLKLIPKPQNKAPPQHHSPFPQGH